MTNTKKHQDTTNVIALFPPPYKLFKCSLLTQQASSRLYWQSQKNQTTQKLMLNDGCIDTIGPHKLLDVTIFSMHLCLLLFSAEVFLEGWGRGVKGGGGSEGEPGCTNAKGNNQK